MTLSSRLIVAFVCLVVGISGFAGGFGTVALFTDSDTVTGTISTGEVPEEAVTTLVAESNPESDDGAAESDDDEHGDAENQTESKDEPPDADGELSDDPEQAEPDGEDDI